ncbi:MAG: lysophospholipase [Candidatus Omnitrophica bacterium]|nr:lysophospholipase [Candidatus Omnitrophota bacterium]
MKQETGYFSSFDGTKLFYRAWEQEGPNALLILHGMGEHSGRYQEAVEGLSELALSFYSYDARGHGRSEGDRMYINQFEDLVSDALSFRQWIEGRSTERRHFILMGQSLGGLVATCLALKHQSDWRALILLSPFFGATYAHPIYFWLTRFLNLIYPKLIWKNPIKPVFLSHDQKEVSLYKQDPLIQRRITSRMAHEMFKGCGETRCLGKELSLPLLLLAGGEDHIVSVEESKRFFESVGSSPKEMKIFPRCYHELLHEHERAEAIQMIKDFLRPHLV